MDEIPKFETGLRFALGADVFRIVWHDNTMSECRIENENTCDTRMIGMGALEDKFCFGTLEVIA